MIGLLNNEQKCTSMTVNDVSGIFQMKSAAQNFKIAQNFFTLSIL